MSVEVLLSRLHGVKSRGPGRWVARCPAHKDREPSLSIREEADGRVLVYDFAGCEVYAVLDALGLSVSELFPARPAEHRSPGVGPAPHVHAAIDALKVMAHEAHFLAMLAHDLIPVAPTPPDRERLIESECRLRAVLRMVAR